MHSIIDSYKAHEKILPSVTPKEVEAYDRYFALLQEWNEKINLVSRKSIGTSFAYHFADSLHIASLAFEHLVGRSLRDLGTGAGFPGLVFAIRYPQIGVALYEKLAKRRTFLEDVVERLELSNVRIHAALPDARFADLFTARAVFPPPELFPFMKRHLTLGGRLIVSVGGSTEVEVPKGFTLLESKTYTLPEDAGARKALVVERST